MRVSVHVLTVSDHRCLMSEFQHKICLASNYVIEKMFGGCVGGRVRGKRKYSKVQIRQVLGKEGKIRSHCGHQKPIGSESRFQLLEKSVNTIGKMLTTKTAAILPLKLSPALVNDTGFVIIIIELLSRHFHCT